MFIIPLTTSPNQKFTSTIPVDGKKIKFNFFLRFNTEAKYWVLDIFDSKNDSLIVSVNLVCGSNLLEQYSYLNIGSAYILKVDATLAGDKPNEYNLGTDFLLLWGDTL
ncbi:hypothetical protein CLPUN_42410 [Clostridium puniceum]|uniref:Cyanophage baseplate Pam3 plug gp18 domain-containing protein n=1 Tax=Clostridium puniceum TaxID=29367 RepID=A0A1S8T8C7_9CLOT|nr:hypothetical protein [Clostridium puniceum]OOM74003.1 hypothetical protein CLPUN_42410 [Clostridium puniceum]